jgi:putative glutamine amidotransferase
MKPLIAITMRFELDSRRFYLGRDYSEALAGSGGAPLHVGLIPDREYIRSVLAGCRGVLLPGSDSDVDPLRYGREPRPGLGRVIEEKDKTDLIVLEEAEEAGIPVFAICFGMQILNVFRGGTLVQDIDGFAPGSVKHEQGPPLSRNSHSIDIVEGSRLYTACRSPSALVNSHHHQAVDELGKNLKVAARARDGIIEAIEDTRPNRYNLGVQWHPEVSWQTDPLSGKLFSIFVDRCKNNK